MAGATARSALRSQSTSVALIGDADRGPLPAAIASRAAASVVSMRSSGRSL
jgi:hypothetical protein